MIIIYWFYYFIVTESEGALYCARYGIGKQIIYYYVYYYIVRFEKIFSFQYYMIRVFRQSYFMLIYRL